jgi:hypothetical protein
LEKIPNPPPLAIFGCSAKCILVRGKTSMLVRKYAGCITVKVSLQLEHKLAANKQALLLLSHLLVVTGDCNKIRESYGH